MHTFFTAALVTLLAQDFTLVNSRSCQLLFVDFSYLSRLRIPSALSIFLQSHYRYLRGEHPAFLMARAVLDPCVDAIFKSTRGEIPLLAASDALTFKDLSSIPGNGVFGPGGDMLCVENCMLAHSFYEQRMIDLKDSSTETLVVRLSSLLIPLCSGFCKCVNFWNLMCCYIAEMLCAHYDDL
ncbi:hypothetical protein K435DRAFT_843192 [Dendrothele bispora CBS 962.96]|uniref:Uncharacterized protein n=1 Tax=Dendrothele bispora (strain CBS 962.96) TaxID=1314807 RepID=A0A4S8LAF5_DENBC|nr:hypothetical protein K435DRAFT_843192 [Dendrothele bispora CBS 962.96]